MTRLPTCLTLLLLPALLGCTTEPEYADAYGHFEAREILISAEQAGPLLWLDPAEGDQLERGQVVGLIDTIPVHLQREEVEARLAAIATRTQDPSSRIQVLAEKRRNLQRELERTRELLRGEAATERQLDDLAGRIEVVDQEIASLREQARIANRAVLAERRPLQARLRQLEEQIRRHYIRSPAAGTVLLRLAEGGEMAAPGKPLLKIARLDTLELRAYIGGAQLPRLRLGQRVEVQIDRDASTNQALPGTVAWIAEEAEFTPKNIQTKNERVNLVYALRIRVPNDGRLKIGMPGELHLEPEPDLSTTAAGAQ